MRMPSPANSVEPKIMQVVNCRPCTEKAIFKATFVRSPAQHPTKTKFLERQTNLVWVGLSDLAHHEP